MLAELIGIALRLLCGCNARWTAPSTDAEPKLYFANHTSHLDALIVWTALPGPRRARFRIIAARDYWGRGPIRRWLACRVFRAVLIARAGSTRSDNLLTVVSACLREGCSVLVFPEGTRGEERTPSEFRSGLWHIARRCEGLELVPVWIENLGRVLPRGELLPIPLLAAVSFGEPIALRESETKADFLARARDAVISLGAPPA